MAIITPEQQVQQVQQCIQECNKTVSELQNLAQQANQTELISSLKEAVHHLEMCIHECTYATKATP